MTNTHRARKVLIRMLVAYIPFTPTFYAIYDTTRKLHPPTPNFQEFNTDIVIIFYNIILYGPFLATIVKDWVNNA